MEVPAVINQLITAQEQRDSAKYIACFTDTATVHDEGKTHTGKAEIRRWNEKTTLEYNMVWSPKAFEATDNGGILTTAVSGTFPGSPITMQFHFEIENGLIQSITMKG